jgi:hypothetical protein
LNSERKEEEKLDSEKNQMWRDEVGNLVGICYRNFFVFISGGWILEEEGIGEKRGWREGGGEKRGEWKGNTVEVCEG